MNFDNETFNALGEIIKSNPSYEKRTGNDEKYQKFVTQHPSNKITQLSMDDYCLGKDSKPENFSWWIERGLEHVLGRYSPGTSRGHQLYKHKDGGIYKNRKLADLSDSEALKYILKIHSVVANANCEQDISWIDDDSAIYQKAGVEPRITMGNSRKLRMLGIYNPDTILPITSSDHIAQLLVQLGCNKEEIPPRNHPVARLLLLNQFFYAAKKQFNAALTPYGFMTALYSEELGIRPITDKSSMKKSNISSEEDIYHSVSDDLNQILYGPPGTGKTYTTTEHAVKLAEPDWYEELIEQELSSEEFRKQIKGKYDSLIDASRIAFTTFHQSFSYEDFIEGIRATTNKESNQIQYKIEEGVFKKIAMDAYRSISTSESLGLSAVPKVWKISIGRRHDFAVRKHYIENGEARIGWNNTGDLSLDYDERTEEEQAYWDSLKNKSQASIRNFSETVEVGDIFLCLKNVETVQAIGVVTSDYQFDPENNNTEEQYAHSRKVNWLLKDIEFNILPINKQKRLVQQTFYQLERISWDDIVTELKIQGHKLPNTQTEKETVNVKPNYVLIIDEINRGNIARIFGELITLLEADKRRGREDARKVILPYSKEEFSVPDNLYVLGTMNTADKSLEQLDLALRRRFNFIELLPIPELLHDIKVYDFRISDLLSVINQRIEVLLDREHLIGHSYFWSLKNLDTDIERQIELADIFEKKIIPLLQEYFFADWERINWVLNDIDKPFDIQFIQLKSKNEDLSKLFSRKVASDLSDRRYTINSDAFHNPESYRGIFVQKEKG